MEDAGIIQGYSASINLENIGLPMGVYISAKVRFGQNENFYELVQNSPEIVECHKLTGNDCLLLRANVRNTRHLDELNSKLSHYGELTTSLILSSVLEGRIYSGELV